MYEIISVGAAPGGDAWLILAPQKTALYETGYAYSAPQMIKNLKAALNGRGLDCVILSHSHYDHASGSVLVRREFPGVTVMAGAYCAKVFTRPGAIRTIRQMNDNVAKLADAYPYEDLLDSLSVDQTLADGDEIDLGGLRLTVWETPGHTKCSLSFFSREEKLLLASETLGTPAGPMNEAGGFIVVPSFMVGCESSIRAIERAMAAEPKTLLMTHSGIISGDMPMVFLRQARHWAEEAKTMVVEGYRAGKTVSELKAMWKRVFYTPEIAGKQPEAAFDLNLGYIISAMLKEYLDVSPETA